MPEQWAPIALSPEQLAQMTGPVPPSAPIGMSLEDQARLGIDRRSAPIAISPDDLARLTGVQKATSIGPPQPGTRIQPTSGEGPLTTLARWLVGDIRPSSVVAQDPFGITGWERGAGQPPLMFGTTQAPGEGAMEMLAQKFPRLAKVIKAYHGSPHDFEQFDLSKIGTGEGAQAYGYGLYFAENPAVAEDYKRRLSGAAGIIPGNSSARAKLMVGGIPQPEGIAGHRALDTAQDIQGLLYYRKSGYSDMEKVVRDQLEGRIQRWKAEGPGTGTADSDMRALVDFYETHVKGAKPEAISERPPGKMYEVAIHADPESFLDWDKPLSQQNAKAQKSMQSVAAALKRDYQVAYNSNGPGTGWGFIDSKSGYSDTSLPSFSSREAAQEFLDDPTGADLYEHASRWQRGKGATPEQVSQRLKQAGIPGIKYLDQGSRAAGEGSRNYVVFDDKIIKIMKKYGVGLAVAQQIYQRQQQEQSGK